MSRVFLSPVTLLEAAAPETGITSLLGRPSPLSGLERGAPGEHERLVAAVRAAAAAPEPDSLLDRWRTLAGLGRRDLVLGRLAEGHLDATAILREAGREPVPGAVYGVWASRSQGTGLRAERDEAVHAWRLTGTLRYATGAPWIDRALVTALTPAGEQVLLDADLRAAGWEPVPGTWAAVGMDLSESLDVEVDAVVPVAAEVGPPGFYLNRPGFALGGIGVAAVWLGGAAGVLDTIVGGLRRFAADGHQLAHLGAMEVALRSADAELVRSAATGGGPAGALAARSAVDAAVRTVLDRAPRLTGPTPLCRDAGFAHRMADLLVYERQHHAERDLEALGRAVVADGAYGPVEP